MSEFHGGFLVRSDAVTKAELIRRALAAALTRRQITLAGNSVTFATRRDSPVFHVAVRGTVADGKDYAFFHEQNAELGAEVARAAGTDVWAYHYENQVGSESVRAFGADGTLITEVHGEWDRLAEAHGPHFAVHAPLGVLAKALGAERALLDSVLAYDTPSVKLRLDAADCSAEVAAYFAGPLLGSVPELGDTATPMRDGLVQTLYFPSTMAHEITALADKLGTSVDVIAWAAWEAAKHEMHRTISVVGRGEAVRGARPTFTLAPPSSAPPQLDIPRLVPVHAKALGPLAGSDDKVGQRMALPEAMLREVTDFATSRDRSLSWTVQKAYLLTRDRLHHATAR
jgi:uncharacterized small protein (TIGR04563 family)